MPTRMRNRLREALGHLWTSLWTPRRPVGVATEHEEEGGGRPDARAHFWREFRAGQREAEAHGSRPR